MHLVCAAIVSVDIEICALSVEINEISRREGGVEFEYFPFGPFGFDPRFEQLLITAAQSIFQIQKGQTGSL